LGRSGDRVANTPVSGRLGSDRGWTFRVSRRARCNQVRTMTSSPTANPSSACATDGRTSSQASGAPSEPCFGALLRSLILDRSTPIGRSSRGPLSFVRFLDPRFFAVVIGKHPNIRSGYTALRRLGRKLGSRSRQMLPVSHPVSKAGRDACPMSKSAP